MDQGVHHHNNNVHMLYTGNTQISELLGSTPFQPERFLFHWTSAKSDLGYYELDVSRALHDINSCDVFYTYFICSFHFDFIHMFVTPVFPTTCIWQSQKRTPYFQSMVTIQE